MSADPHGEHPVLILHGLEGSGPEHWQRWLAGRLEQRGLDVRFPELADADDPQPGEWLAQLEAELERIGSPDATVVCHSLACLLWLRAAASHDRRLARRVLLVAPPWRSDIDAVARFIDHGAGAEHAGRAAGSTRIVCSDEDPYCPRGAVETFAEPLEIEAHVVAGAAHINTDAGYGPWPAVERWVLGEPVADWART